MGKAIDSPCELMSRLTISALEEICQDSSCWKEQIVHKALLVTGLSVLTASTQLLINDLKDMGEGT